MRREEASRGEGGRRRGEEGGGGRTRSARTYFVQSQLTRPLSCGGLLFESAPPHRLIAPRNVFLIRPREAADPHRHAVNTAFGNTSCRLCHLRHRVEVALRRDREARLADVDIQPRKLPCNVHLLALGERRAWRLLAVAERRICVGGGYTRASAGELSRTWCT